jgi:DNA-binding MarR family transcriptional regulator
MYDASGGEDVTEAANSPDQTNLHVPERQPQAVGFLLSQLGYEVAGRFSKLMAEVQIEPRQFAVMRSIGFADGKSQNAVGEWLRIPPSSMVALIDQLESRGFVERRRHPTDRRTRTLHLTEQGREILETATSLAMSLEETICKGLSPEVRGSLMGILIGLAENLGLVQVLHPGMPEEAHGH